MPVSSVYNIKGEISVKEGIVKMLGSGCKKKNGILNF